jgi:hypothetical protein
MIQLFKAGTGEIGTFDEFSYLHLLKQGWHYTPEGCYAEEKDQFAQKEIEPEETTEETTPAQKEGVLSPKDALRARAKSAGITHSWMKSTVTLEKELKESEDEYRSEG